MIRFLVVICIATPILGAQGTGAGDVSRGIEILCPSWTVVTTHEFFHQEDNCGCNYTREAAAWALCRGDRSYTINHAQVWGPDSSCSAAVAGTGWIVDEFRFNGSCDDGLCHRGVVEAKARLRIDAFVPRLNADAADAAVGYVEYRDPIRERKLEATRSAGATSSGFSIGGGDSGLDFDFSFGSGRGPFPDSKSAFLPPRTRLTDTFDRERVTYWHSYAYAWEWIPLAWAEARGRGTSSCDSTVILSCVRL